MSRYGFPLLLPMTVLGLAALITMPSLAGDVNQSATVTVTGIVSDNIAQTAQDQAEADINLQVTPSLQLDSQGGRVGWTLELAANTDVYLLGTETDRIEPTVLGVGQIELLADRLFLSGGLSLRQAFSEERARGPGGQGAALGEAQEGVFSAFLNPRWQSDLAGYAAFVGNYQVDYVNADGDSGYNHQLELELSSGRRSPLLEWQLDYLGEWSEPSDAPSTKSQEFRAEVDYLLMQDWSLSGLVGYVSGEGINNQGNDIDGGFYWSFGGRWSPSRRLQLQVLLGPDNQEFYFSFRPTVRSELSLSLQDNNFGQNVGRTWAADFRHRSRYGFWVLRYEEATTSQLESEVNEVTRDPAFEEVDDVLDPASTLGLSDERFFRRRLQTSVDYRRRRTSIGLRTAFEEREFLASDEQARTWEVGVNWRWLLGRRTSTVLDVAWEHVRLRGGGDERFMSLALGLDYQFAEDLQAYLGYTHLQVDSSQGDNDFRENRVGLLLRMEF